MENCHYSDVINSVSSIPIKILHSSSRLILDNLDCKIDFVSDKSFPRDYRGLAEQIGFPYSWLRRIEERGNCTAAILENWENNTHATIGQLITYLENMDRYDIIEQLIPSLKRLADKNCSKFQEFVERPVQVPEVSSGSENSHTNENNRLLTLEDLRNGECTRYDAFVCCADEDIQIAAEFARVLESHDIGLKLLICERDKAAGCSDLDSDLELIKNRCRHMLIILTPNFMKSPVAEFQISFAGSVSVRERRCNLIAVICLKCEIPPILDVWSKIDLTKELYKEWNMHKLITSLKFGDRNSSASYVRNELPSSRFFVPGQIAPTGILPPTAQPYIDAPIQMNPITVPKDADNEDEEVDSGACNGMHHSITRAPSSEFPKNRPILSKVKKFIETIGRKQ